jgi:hypothetical protein
MIVWSLISLNLSERSWRDMRDSQERAVCPHGESSFSDLAFVSNAPPQLQATRSLEFIPHYVTLRNCSRIINTQSVAREERG